MNCRHYQEQIMLELDGELDRGSSSRLAAHISECACCAEFRERTRMLFEQLDAELVILPDVDLAPLVVEKLQPRSSKPPVRLLLGSLAAAVIFFNAAIAVVSLWRWLGQVNLAVVWNVAGFLLRIASTTHRALQQAAEALPLSFWLTAAAVLLLIQLVVLRVIRMSHPGGYKP